jgi:hypothetical protein
VKATGLCPRLLVSADGTGLVSRGGGLLLTRTAAATGLDAGLSAGLARWRAVHDPGKIAGDLAVMLALGGDCLADAALLRAEPGLFGPVASGPVISRLVSALAADSVRSLRAVRGARAAARRRAWQLAGAAAPGAGGDLVTADLDATVVIAHSEKENAAPTWKKTFGFHPLCAFADHGPAGTGEPLAIVPRPGNAGANTAAGHIAVTRLALARLPPGARPLIRAGGAGGTHEFAAWLHRRRLRYSAGFPVTAPGVEDAVRQVPARAWTPAYDAGGVQRDGARVAELTGLPDLPGWPAGMRVIARKERPHPGAQLRLTDADGNRVTCFATRTRGGHLADLELQHRRRARCEDRIRNAKATGPRALPLRGFARNQAWRDLAALAGDLIAWTQLLALHDTPARRREPRRPRSRLFITAGRIVSGGRRTRLCLAARSPRSALITTALSRLGTLAPG